MRSKRIGRRIPGVLGVKPLTPCISQAEIKPQLGTGTATAGLTTASGTVPTIRGPITLKLENSATTYKLRVKIPGNMTAKVFIPKKGYLNPVLVYDGKVVAAATIDGRLTLDNVSSGEHAVWLSSPATPTAAVLKDNWLAAMFGDDASNPAVTRDLLDPDNDGQSNENEFLRRRSDPLRGTLHVVPSHHPGQGGSPLRVGTLSFARLAVMDSDRFFHTRPRRGSTHVLVHVPADAQYILPRSRGTAVIAAPLLVWVTRIEWFGEIWKPYVPPISSRSGSRLVQLEANPPKNP